VRNAARNSKADEAPRWPVLQALGWSRKDAFAFGIGACATIAILVNGLMLQTGVHPAPMFKAAGQAARKDAPKGNTVASVPRPHPPAVAAKVEPKTEPPPPAPPMPPPRPNAAKNAPAAAAARPPAQPPRSDSIAQLLGPAKRVIAVQRALAEFGYGQLKPTGVVDAETKAAVEKFERERKLPVTGQVSERVLRELASITGHPLE
jgi:hypothetical protein